MPRTQARVGVEVTDAALLRRLLLKHYVYGTDVSPMGAEIATLSLWLASFVPGLSLAYMDCNVVVGNALISVAAASSVVPEGTFQEQSLRTALAPDRRSNPQRIGAPGTVVIGVDQARCQFEPGAMMVSTIDTFMPLTRSG